MLLKLNNEAEDHILILDFLVQTINISIVITTPFTRAAGRKLSKQEIIPLKQEDHTLLCQGAYGCNSENIDTFNTEIN